MTTVPAPTPFSLSPTRQILGVPVTTFSYICLAVGGIAPVLFIILVVIAMKCYACRKFRHYKEYSAQLRASQELWEYDKREPGGSKPQNGRARGGSGTGSTASEEGSSMRRTARTPPISGGKSLLCGLHGGDNNSPGGAYHRETPLLNLQHAKNPRGSSSSDQRLIHGGAVPNGVYAVNHGLDATDSPGTERTAGVTDRAGTAGRLGTGLQDNNSMQHHDNNTTGHHDNSNTLQHVTVHTDSGHALSDGPSPPMRLTTVDETTVADFSERPRTLHLPLSPGKSPGGQSYDNSGFVPDSDPSNSTQTHMTDSSNPDSTQTYVMDSTRL